MSITPSTVILGILIAAVAILIVMLIIFLLGWKNGAAPFLASALSSEYMPENFDMDPPPVFIEDTADPNPTDEVPHEEPVLDTVPPKIENTPRPEPDKLLPSDNIASFSGDILVGSELNNA
uniref:Uncharacterized protein n=1 Tax=viral metagenome TaxID=1070528 RepID=A0A6C0LTK5_9ZZZZ